MNQYNISPTKMGQIPLKGLVMVKRKTTPKICAIDMWCDLAQYETTIETIVRMHL
jgi:hypothetical protein